MSISATLSNALTGLAAVSRSAQIVSTNVANATTEGYARREIELSARVAGGVGAGVQVDGVVRVVDENILRERRLSAAALGLASEPADFLQNALEFLGQPDDPSSLTARVVAFETTLLDATARPESEARLSAVATAAQSLTSKLNDASDRTQALRQDADRTIASEIQRLNASLEQIGVLNEQILRARGSDRDYPSLLDSRQKLIDDISELVPIRQLPRDNGTVALYTMNGSLLLDARPAVFEFTRTEPITADMTLSSGALSGITLNGQSISVGDTFSPIGGGRLEGLFTVRDDLAISLQDDLDSMARDLISRFEDPAMDPSLSVGDAGLFTDRGSPLDTGNIVGLASRISVNSNVVPAEGGFTWRLRDGLGAATQGSIGEPALLQAMLERFQEARSPIGGSLSTSARSVSALSGDLLSIVGQAANFSKERVVFEQSRLAGLDEALLSEGVDTDQEMQKLLLIEQAYAANARVIQTADELIQILIGL